MSYESIHKAIAQSDNLSKNADAASRMVARGGGAKLDVNVASPHKPEKFGHSIILAKAAAGTSDVVGNVLGAFVRRYGTASFETAEATIVAPADPFEDPADNTKYIVPDTYDGVDVRALKANTNDKGVVDAWDEGHLGVYLAMLVVAVIKAPDGKNDLAFTDKRPESAARKAMVSARSSKGSHALSLADIRTIHNAFVRNPVAKRMLVSGVFKLTRNPADFPMEVVLSQFKLFEYYGSGAFERAKKAVLSDRALDVAFPGIGSEVIELWRAVEARRGQDSFTRMYGKVCEGDRYTTTNGAGFKVLHAIGLAIMRAEQVSAENIAGPQLGRDLQERVDNYVKARYG